MALQRCARRCTVSASSVASTSRYVWPCCPLARPTFATEVGLEVYQGDTASTPSLAPSGYVTVIPRKPDQPLHASPLPGESDAGFRWRAAWALSGYACPPVPHTDHSHVETTPKTPWRPGVRRVGCVGKKLGSISMWDANGECKVVHVVRLQNNYVWKVKHHETHDTVFVSGGGQPLSKMDPGQRSLFARARVPPPAYFDTFKVHQDGVPPLYSILRALHFVPGQWVDVKGKTRDRGFDGAVNRWGFKGGPASHGSTKFHRKFGTVKPGSKMPGHKGALGRTSACRVVRIDTELDLVYLIGDVPGNKDNWVSLQDSHGWFLAADKNKHGIVGLPFPAGTAEVQRRLGDVPKEITLLELGRGPVADI